jgi:hypothetical protein
MIMALNITGESAPVQWGVLPIVPRGWLEIILVPWLGEV